MALMLCAKRLIPIIKKTIPEINLSKKAGIRLETDPPARAPKSVANIRAIEEPINTAKGLLVVLLKVIVVSCVLSPISARNTVTNVVKRSVRSIKLVQVLMLNKVDKTLC